MTLPITNNPSDEQLEEAHRIVMEKDPDTLYRALDSMDILEMSVEIVYKMARVYSYYIYHLYLLKNETPPEDKDQLQLDLERISHELKTPIESAVEVVELADYWQYIQKHNLQWVLDAIEDFMGYSDVDVDLEFIYNVHKANNNLPTEPELIAVLYLAWLDINLSS